MLTVNANEKKTEEKTFKEYWEKAEKQGIEREAVEEVKREIFETLRKEGFLDEQIDEMQMGKVWNSYLFG